MQERIVWMRLPLGDDFDRAKLISSVDDQIQKNFRQRGQVLKNPPAVKEYEEPNQENHLDAFYFELDTLAASSLEKWLGETTGLDLQFTASKENVVDRQGFPNVGLSKSQFLQLCEYVKSHYAETYRPYAQSLRYKLIERVVYEGDRDPIDGMSAKEAGTLLAFLDTKLSPTFQELFDLASETVIKKIADGVCAVIRQDFPDSLRDA